MSIASPVSHVSQSTNACEINGLNGRQHAETASPTVSHSSPTSELRLTPAQQITADELEAFCLGQLDVDVATLAGYAGVGKTTVVADVVSRLPLDDMSVVVAAPTHKAVAVLGEKLGAADVELATLHSLLGLKLSNRDDGSQVVVDEKNGSSLHHYQLAIVDEASMVSAGLFEAVLTKRQRCRVLFVGDPAQLAPVDGNGELSPAFSELVPKHWRMTEVVRQAKDNPIIRLATEARGCIERGEIFSLHALGAQLVAGDDAFMAVQPGGVAEVSRLVADAIQHGQDTRALAWDNATVLAINANVHAMVYPGQGEYPKGTQVMANDSMTAIDCTNRIRKVPVRNSALLTVESSELARHPDEPSRLAFRLVVRTEEGQLLECWVAEDQKQLQADISERFAEFRRVKLREQMATSGGERQALREEARAASGAGWALRGRYAPLRYAYAMTVHKSQGSTFDAVVLDWASFERCRDVPTRNRLIYVALTRTRRFAVVCA
jgi:exodeoxyribonuclease-5